MTWFPKFSPRLRSLFNMIRILTRSIFLFATGSHLDKFHPVISTLFLPTWLLPTCCSGATVTCNPCGQQISPDQLLRISSKAASCALALQTKLLCLLLLLLFFLFFWGCVFLPPVPALYIMPSKVTYIISYMIYIKYQKLHNKPLYQEDQNCYFFNLLLNSLNT